MSLKLAVDDVYSKTMFTVFVMDDDIVVGGGGGGGGAVNRRPAPINGMDQAVLDQEGDMNTFNNRIYRITAHNFI